MGLFKIASRENLPNGMVRIKIGERIDRPNFDTRKISNRLIRGALIDNYERTGTDLSPTRFIQRGVERIQNVRRIQEERRANAINNQTKKIRGRLN